MYVLVCVCVWMKWELFTIPLILSRCFPVRTPSASIRLYLHFQSFIFWRWLGSCLAVPFRAQCACDSFGFLSRHLNRFLCDSWFVLQSHVYHLCVCARAICAQKSATFDADFTNQWLIHFPPRSRVTLISLNRMLYIFLLSINRKWNKIRKLTWECVCERGEWICDIVVRNAHHLLFYSSQRTASFCV